MTPYHGENSGDVLAIVTVGLPIALNRVYGLYICQTCGTVLDGDAAFAAATIWRHIRMHAAEASPPWSIPCKKILFTKNLQDSASLKLDGWSDRQKNLKDEITTPTRKLPPVDGLFISRHGWMCASANCFFAAKSCDTVNKHARAAHNISVPHGSTSTTTMVPTPVQLWVKGTYFAINLPANLPPTAATPPLSLSDEPLPPDIVDDTILTQADIPLFEHFSRWTTIVPTEWEERVRLLTEPTNKFVSVELSSRVDALVSTWLQARTVAVFDKSRVGIREEMMVGTTREKFHPLKEQSSYITYGTYLARLLIFQLILTKKLPPPSSTPGPDNTDQMPADPTPDFPANWSTALNDRSQALYSELLSAVSNELPTDRTNVFNVVSKFFFGILCSEVPFEHRESDNNVMRFLVSSTLKKGGGRIVGNLIGSLRKTRFATLKKPYLNIFYISQGDRKSLPRR